MVQNCSVRKLIVTGFWSNWLLKQFVLNSQILEACFFDHKVNNILDTIFKVNNKDTSPPFVVFLLLTLSRWMFARAELQIENLVAYQKKVAQRFRHQPISWHWSLSIPPKNWKTLMFSGGAERDQWHEMSLFCGFNDNLQHKFSSLSKI